MVKTRGKASKLAEQGLPDTPPQALADTTRSKRTTRQTTRTTRSRSASVVSIHSDTSEPSKPEGLSKPKGRGAVKKKSKDTKKTTTSRRKPPSRQTTPASDADDEVLPTTEIQPTSLPQLIEEDEETHQARDVQGPPSVDAVEPIGPLPGNETVSSPLSSPLSSPELPAKPARRVSDTAKLFKRIAELEAIVEAREPAKSPVQGKNIFAAADATAAGDAESPAPRNSGAPAVDSPPRAASPPPVAGVNTTSVGVQANFSGSAKAEFTISDAGHGLSRDGTKVPYTWVKTAIPTEMLPELGGWIANHRLVRNTDLPLQIDKELTITLLGYETYPELPDQKGMINVNGERKLPTYVKELDTDSENEGEPPATPNAAHAGASSNTNTDAPDLTQTPEPRAGFFSTLSKTVSRFVPSFGLTPGAPQQSSISTSNTPNGSTSTAQTDTHSAQAATEPRRPRQRNSHADRQSARVGPLIPPRVQPSRPVRENQFLDPIFLPKRNPRVLGRTAVDKNATESLRREHKAPKYQKLEASEWGSIDTTTEERKLKAFTDALREKRRLMKKTQRQEDAERRSDAEYRAQRAEEQMDKAVEELRLTRDELMEWRLEKAVRARGGTPDNPLNFRQGLRKKMEKEKAQLEKQQREWQAMKDKEKEPYLRLTGQMPNDDGTWNPRATSAPAWWPKEHREAWAEEEHARNLELIKKFGTNCPPDLRPLAGKIANEEQAQQANNTATNQPASSTSTDQQASSTSADQPVSSTDKDQQPDITEETAQATDGKAQDGAGQKRSKKRKRPSTPARSAIGPDGGFYLPLDYITYSDSSDSSDEEPSAKKPQTPRTRKSMQATVTEEGDEDELEYSIQPDSGAKVFKVPSPTSSDDDFEPEPEPEPKPKPKYVRHPITGQWMTPFPPPPAPPKSWYEDQRKEATRVAAMKKREEANKYKPKYPSKLKQSSRLSNSTIVSDNGSVRDSFAESFFNPRPVSPFKTPTAKERAMVEEDSEEDDFTVKGKATTALTGNSTKGATAPIVDLTTNTTAPTGFFTTGTSATSEESAAGKVATTSNEESTVAKATQEIPTTKEPAATITTEQVAITDATGEADAAVGNKPTGAPSTKEPTIAEPAAATPASQPIPQQSRASNMTSTFSLGAAGPSFASQPSTIATPASTFPAPSFAPTSQSFRPEDCTAYEDYVKDKPFLAYFVQSEREKDPAGYNSAAQKTFADGFAAIEAAASAAAAAAPAAPAPAPAPFDPVAWVEANFSAADKKDAEDRFAALWAAAAEDISTP